MFLSISESAYRRLGLPDRGLRMKGIAQIGFSRKSVFMKVGIVLTGLGDCFSDFLGLENRFVNRGIFGDVTDPEFGISALQRDTSIA